MNRVEENIGNHSVGIFRQELSTGAITLSENLRNVSYINDLSSICHYEELVQKIIYPDDQGPILNILRKVESGSSNNRGDFRLKLENDYRWNDCLISMKTSENVLEILFVDIHERKLEHEELVSENKALEVAAESVHIGIWDWDFVSNDLKWNKRMFELFDIDPKLFKSSYDDFAGRVHKEDLPIVEEEIKKALRGEKVYKAEYRIVHNNGDELLIAADGVILKNSKGENQRMIGVCVNISDKREFEKFQAKKSSLLASENELLNELVNEQTIELQRAIEELQSFAYSISHDLSAPLRAITGFTDILRDEYEEKNDEEFGRLLGIIRQSSVKLKNQITTILDYNRLNSVEVVYGDVPLDKVVSDEINAHSISSSLKEVVFEISELPVIKADLALIKMMVKQLISNALKFTSPNTDRRISITYEIEDKEHKISVIDNGVGFDMKYYNKLFTIFQRLHREHEFEGTGVGLAIVKKIVEKHKGIVYATSTPFVETKFSVHIPVVK